MSRYTPRKPQTIKRDIKQLIEEIESLKATLDSTQLSDTVRKQLEHLLRVKTERLENLKKIFDEMCKPEW